MAANAPDPLTALATAFTLEMPFATAVVDGYDVVVCPLCQKKVVEEAHLHHEKHLDNLQWAGIQTANGGQAHGGQLSWLIREGLCKTLPNAPDNIRFVNEVDVAVFLRDGVVPLAPPPPISSDTATGTMFGISAHQCRGHHPGCSSDKMPKEDKEKVMQFEVRQQDKVQQQIEEHLREVDLLKTNLEVMMSNLDAWKEKTIAVLRQEVRTEMEMPRRFWENSFAFMAGVAGGAFGILVCNISQRGM